MWGEVCVHHGERAIDNSHEVLAEGAVNGIGDEFQVMLVAVPI